MRAVSSLPSSSGSMDVAARPILAFKVAQAGGIEGSVTFRVSWAGIAAGRSTSSTDRAETAFILTTDYHNAEDLWPRRAVICAGGLGRGWGSRPFWGPR